MFRGPQVYLKQECMGIASPEREQAHKVVHQTLQLWACRAEYGRDIQHHHLPQKTQDCIIAGTLNAA